MYYLPMGMVLTTIGEILVDLTQTGTDRNGVALFAANPGGAPANVAVAASRLGCRSRFVGCIGNDSFGAILRKTLEDNGVGTDGLQTTDCASTTLAVVTVDGKGERSFSFCRKPGADTVIDTEKAVRDVRGTGILHFGSVSLAAENCRDTIKAAVKAGKESGAIISYDPNYRSTLWNSTQEAEEVMRSVLDMCDIVKISDEETLLMTGCSSPEDAARVLHGQGVKLVLVTLGADGAYWSFNGMSGHVDGFRVKVADTNGAGDTFFGSLLSRIALRGGLEGLGKEELEDFVRFANKAASITSSRSGAIPAMPTLDEVQGEVR